LSVNIQAKNYCVETSPILKGEREEVNRLCHFLTHLLLIPYKKLSTKYIRSVIVNGGQLQKAGNIFENQKAPGIWQDKGGLARKRATSSQPSRAGIPARGKKKHSTRRRTVQAAGWIDHATDAYIVHRTILDPKHSRSKVVADMLRERAQSDVFEKNQELFTNVIQKTIRAEFRLFKDEFTNRYMALLARIAYQVSHMLHLLLGVISILPGIPLHLEIESEKQARIHIARRTPQIEEVIGRLRQEVEGD
jgi:hypothetical protein